MLKKFALATCLETFFKKFQVVSEETLGIFKKYCWSGKVEKLQAVYNKQLEKHPESDGNGNKMIKLQVVLQNSSIFNGFAKIFDVSILCH